MKPRVPLREGLVESGKQAILVAPTLGPKSQPGSLLEPGGLDRYLGQVLSALAGTPTWADRAAPGLGHLVIAAHSGSGITMLRLALSRNRVLAQLRECWGFDCFYGGDTAWGDWAKKNPKKTLFAYHATRTPRRIAQSLAARKITNLRILPAPPPPRGSMAHFAVLDAGWKERVARAEFLKARG
jgi:hypothetical protein